MMAEPISSTTATAAGISAGAKFAIAAGVGSALLGLYVIATSHPESKSDWTKQMVSTVAGSILAGSVVIQYFHLAQWANEGLFGLMAIGGVMFTTGILFWVALRTLMEYVKSGKGFIEFLKDARQAWKGKDADG